MVPETVPLAATEIPGGTLAVEMLYVHPVQAAVATDTVGKMAVLRSITQLVGHVGAEGA